MRGERYKDGVHLVTEPEWKADLTKSWEEAMERER